VRQAANRKCLFIKNSLAAIADGWVKSPNAAAGNARSGAHSGASEHDTAQRFRSMVRKPVSKIWIR
jgi:hypothetical protein